MDSVPFEAFQQLDLRVAKVLRVAPHPNADKLYLLTVDGGSEERQIVAGLRQHYPAEELEGRSIIVIWNLEPATIRGETSQGMLLAADDRETQLVSVLSPHRPVAPGSRVR